MPNPKAATYSRPVEVMQARLEVLRTYVARIQENAGHAHVTWIQEVCKEALAETPACLDGTEPLDVQMKELRDRIEQLISNATDADNAFRAQLEEKRQDVNAARRERAEVEDVLKVVESERGDYARNLKELSDAYDNHKRDWRNDLVKMTEERDRWKQALADELEKTKGLEAAQADSAAFRQIGLVIAEIEMATRYLAPGQLQRNMVIICKDIRDLMTSPHPGEGWRSPKDFENAVRESREEAAEHFKQREAAHMEAMELRRQLKEQEIQLKGSRRLLALKVAREAHGLGFTYGQEFHEVDTLTPAQEEAQFLAIVEKAEQES